MREKLEYWCRQPPLRPSSRTLREYFDQRQRPHNDIINPAELSLAERRAGGVRQAAVLILVSEEADGPHVTLTRRTEHLPTHAGQISFPGGALDPQDADATAAALREAHEEIGLELEKIRVIGHIGRYYTVTGFEVHPVVACTAHRQASLNLRPEPGEVADILCVPLHHLMNPANYQVAESRYAGVLRHYYSCHWQQERIWGATAGMLIGLYRELLTARP